MAKSATITAKKSRSLSTLAGDESIIDKRAVTIGLALSAALVVLGLAWKLTTAATSQRKPEEFKFSVDEPKTEEFKVNDPVRDIIKERPENEEKVEEIKDERPNIQISTNPVDVPVPQEVVQSKNLDVATPKIDVAGSVTDVPDAPLEISQVSETVQNAINPIAADSNAPADLFKYAEPSPRDRPLVAHVNAGPRPARSLKALPQAFGDQDVPTMGTLGAANVNLFGTGEFFQSRDLSGGIKARTAVDAALHWLAIHQDGDGGWDAVKYEGAVSASLADTALACLAFMGAGHHPRRGEYRRNVVKGIQFLLKNQKPDGRFLFKGENLYTHAICTIAVCEAFGRAHDDELASAAQKAIDYCVKAQNDDGGWRYQPRDGISDVSVTAWFIQVLKTAKLGQIKFDNQVFSRAITYLDSLTDKGAAQESTGLVGYTYQQDQSYTDNGHPALTAAGMVIRQFNGLGQKNHLLIKGAEATRMTPPNWKGNKDFYYWYYATYAMHNMGGEFRIWWNQRIRDTLLDNQARDGDNAGSWDPKGDRWGKEAGRVYTTALGALCLEVYYRYSEALNAFGVAPDLDELFLEGGG